MKLEWSAWNLPDWRPLRATTLEEAARELSGNPYAEEAVLRDKETGQTFRRSSRRVNVIHGINCDCCPRW